MRALYAMLICAMAGSSAYAQAGSFAGTVARDSNGTAVGQAEVRLPQLNRAATTNWLGEFQFANVPAGRYAVTVRAIGFDAFTDSIDVKPGARVDGDIILTASPVGLATEHTTAEQRLPPGLQEMAEREKAHLGGAYVGDSALRVNRERKLTYLLSGIAGLHQVLGTFAIDGVYMANGRQGGNGGPAFSSAGSSSPCYVSVFVDGVKRFVGPPSPGNEPPDFNAFLARDYAGIEYYSSGASVPAQYNATGAGCGVLLLWTRR